jgi:hypothetical protein
MGDRLQRRLPFVRLQRGRLPFQAGLPHFRYNGVMQTGSARDARRVVFSLALMLTAAGCEFLGIGKGKPPPLRNPVKETNDWQPQKKGDEQRLPSFGLGGPVAAPAESEPAPAVAATPTGVPAGPGSLNGHPNGLTREALNMAVQGTMGQLASCFSPSAQNPMVAVSFEADPSGRPSLVRINGAPPDAERCVRNIIQGMRLPRFEGNGVHVDLPLTFHQVGRAGQPPGNPGNTAQPPGGGPPLNIEP